MPRKAADKQEQTPKKLTVKPEKKKIAMKPESKKIAMKPAKKAIETRTEPVLSTIVQVGELEFDITQIAEKAYKAYKSVHRRKHVEEFRIYVKPEEKAAYYTVNGEGAAEFRVDLE